jgi:PAS domain S-box-containing protein
MLAGKPADFKAIFLRISPFASGKACITSGLRAPGEACPSRRAQHRVAVLELIMQKRWSIRTYLGLLALAVAVPCALLLVYSIVGDARQDSRQIETTTLNLAQLVASHCQQFITDAEHLATKLSQRPQIRGLDAKVRDPIFDQFLDLYPQFANLVLCDSSGRVLDSALQASPEQSLENVRAHWSQDVVRNGRFTVGKPIMGQLTRRWVCVMGVPVRDMNGNIAGALGMSVDLARFHIAVSPVHLPLDSSITIIDEDGTVVMRSPGAQTVIGTSARNLELVQFVLANSEGNRIGVDFDDEERIYGFTNIRRTGWKVYAGIPTAFAFAATRINTLRAGLVAVALLGLVMALILFLGRLINEPVRALFGATSAIAEGRVQNPVPVTGPKELAAVAAEFNRMMASRQQKEAEIQQLNLELELRVKQRTAELEHANAELQREVTTRKHAQEELRAHRFELQDYIDSMSTMNAKVAPDGTLLLVNNLTQQASGLPAETLMKTNFLEGHWWSFDPQVQQRVRTAFQTACSGTAVNYDEKLFVFNKVIDINFSLIPVPGVDGRVAYIVAEGRDITERKAAEAALAERTLQLETTNKELEAFSYSVSHDLRAPLRGIDGFTKALLEDYGPRLDEEGKEYLQRVRTATLRMSQLIDDLLQLSRISRTALRSDTIDLSSLAKDISNTLKESAPDRAVNFILQPGLIGRGDTRLLRLVLENLLSNAWKFTRGRSPARIEFGVRRVTGSDAYFVGDNGAGFDMAYKHKLFGAFQRLHSSEEYEGTGIGLATVQRIIHRHGGRVWGEGQPDQGAIFYFTLPA